MKQSQNNLINAIKKNIKTDSKKELSPSEASHIKLSEIIKEIKEISSWLSEAIKWYETRILISKNVEIVITGKIGENAKRFLNFAGIELVIENNENINTVINKLKKLI